MNTEIPAAADVQAALKELGHAQMQRLADLSGVPFTTLWKVRQGDTKNPGIETVRTFMPHVEAAKAEAAEQGG